MPDPPNASFIGSLVGDDLKKTMESVSSTGTTDNSAERNANNAHPTKFGNLWKIATEGVKAANAARNTKNEKL